MLKAADRRWEWRRWDGEWDEIVALDAKVVVLKSGYGVYWNETGNYVPSSRVRVRYTCPLLDPEGNRVWMEWRSGGAAQMPMLAQDMGHPEIAQRIRRAAG